MARLREKMPEGAWIARSCSTGYGEELLKAAFSLDEGTTWNYFDGENYEGVP